MKLIDYLRVPYRLEAESVARPDGSWVRRVSYPELPDCVAEDGNLEHAIDALERLRIRAIFDLLKAGSPPAVPRPPIDAAEPAWLIERLGLAADLEPHLDKDERELAGRRPS